jgi:hypothetical protein
MKNKWNLITILNWNDDCTRWNQWNDSTWFLCSRGNSAISDDNGYKFSSTTRQELTQEFDNMGAQRGLVVAQGARRWSLVKAVQLRPLVGPPSIQTTAWKKTLGWRRVFLPAGYPVSVSPDYGPSTAFQFLASVTGTMAGTVSTQALLQALGLGAGTALGLAASTNWIIKDGFGLLGGVLFAGVMGSRFDASPKVCSLPAVV